jgi:Asp-tRNA(Asn)/Glu-tRNA(Gln) amidotransferase A subunit family amidase
MGSDSTGLPMGFQLMTNPFQEDKMLDLGEKLYAYEG